MADNPQGGRKTRRGSARWRQQQRKEKQLQHVQEGTARPRTTRQVNPVGGFKLPEVKMPTGVLRVVIYLGAALFLVLGMIFTLRLFNPPEAVALPNAIWLGTEWSYDLPEDEAVTALTERLRVNRIGTSYVWVTRLKNDLTWSGKSADRNPRTGEVINTVNPITAEPYRDELGEMEPNIIRFVEQYNEIYPEGRLLGWIDYPVGVVPLDDTELHSRVAELATVLVTTYGFDGVYLNVAPVGSGDENYLQLLRTVRLALDDAADGLNVDGRIPLAVGIPPDWRPSDPTIPYNPAIQDVFEWDRAYKQDVALLVDEILLLAFNSGLARPDDFSVWVAYQTKTYAEVVEDLGVETDILVGVPTYPEEPPFHDPTVENIESTITGVNSGLVQASTAADNVRGLAVFMEWETDDSEWAQFQTNWISRAVE